MKAGSYLDMVMPVLKEDVREQSIRIRTVDLGGLFRGEAMEMFQEDQETLQLMQDVSIDGMSIDSRTAPLLSGLIEKELTWKYPYAAAGSMKGKLTVSELKRLHLAEEDAGEALYSGENESSDLMSESSVIPAFAAEETKIAGTARGTLYHRVLEKMPFARVKDMDGLKLFLSEMLEEKQLTEEEEKALNRKKLVKFLQSPLAERMRKAESAGRLRRESPFVLGVPAAEVYPHVTSASEEDVPELNPSGQELILIQGIVDVWFEEEDGIVLVDYKTDRIPDRFQKTGTETSTEKRTEKGTEKSAGTEAERQQTAEEFLVERYRIQLDYYKKALEQLTGKTVKEEIIYSFSLEKAIPLDDK